MASLSLLDENPSAPPALTRFVERLLKHSPLTLAQQTAFRTLSTEAKQCRAGRNVAQSIKGNTDAEELQLVAHGMLGAFSETKHGLRQVTSVYLAGELANLQTVVAPCTACSLYALTDVELLTLQRRELQHLAKEHASIAEAFWRQCAYETTGLSNWALSLGRKPAKARLAHFICDLAYRHELHLGYRVEFDFRVSQTALADIIGQTAVHVNRTIGALRAEGLSFRNKRVVIEDFAHLCSVAGYSAPRAS